MNDVRKTQQEPATPSSPSWLRRGVAAVMSLALPGLGQLKNGQANRAIWVFFAFFFLTVPAVALVAMALPVQFVAPALLLSIVLTIGVWLFAVVDAWRHASLPSAERAKGWQTGGGYLAVFIVAGLFAVPLSINYVRQHVVQSFHVPSASMSPSIEKGDLMFVDMRYNCPGCRRAVRRGDIVVFVYPNNRTIYYLKRLIGLPGDTVRIVGGRVSVNGLALSASTKGAYWSEQIDGRQWRTMAPAPSLSNEVREFVVAPGHVFAMGDNRPNSRDSRHFGTVPLRDVVGMARQVWFSKGPLEIRWHRVGQVLVPAAVGGK